LRALPFPRQPITPRLRSWQDGNPAAGALSLAGDSVKINKSNR
jgi:hypothetical protein